MRRTFKLSGLLVVKILTLLAFLFTPAALAQSPNTGGTNTLPPLTNFSSSAYFYKEGVIRPVIYTADGPTDGSLLFRGAPVVLVSNFFYGVVSTQFARIPSPQGPAVFPPPALDRPIALTFDNVRGRIATLTANGSALIATAFPHINEIPWTLVTNDLHAKFEAVVYISAGDRYYAIEFNTNQQSLNVYRLAINGSRELISSLPNFTPPPAPYRSHLALANDFNMALLLETDADRANTPSGESRIYHISRFNGVAPRLIFSKTWTPWPPVLPPDPTLRITSPLNGSQFTPGANIPITVQAVNANVPYIFVRHSTNRFLTNVVTTGSTQTVSTIWSNVPAGVHTISAMTHTPWGITLNAQPINITVTNSFPFFAERTISTNYTPGRPFTVTINVRLTPNILAWAIEETPPPGWTVSQVSYPGLYDPINRKVKWGPNYSTQPTEWTLTYAVTPPSNSITAATFSGVISVNGQLRGISGQTTTTRAILPHPADTNGDFRLTITEVTTYTTAWRNGADIPISYINRAGLLWRSGETYRFNPLLTPPESWEPSSNTVNVLSVEPITEAAADPDPLLQRLSPHLMRLQLDATPGEQFILESATTIDTQRWQYLATVTGAQPPVDFTNIGASTSQQFYRLRPAD